MSLFYYKPRFSISMKVFIASSFIRVLLILVILLFFWFAILWASLLP
ncbi:hypothetical protein [Candidatus Blochmannia ocreatus (nom. nud.)]|uniref:Uncharacterized protein n=1 Tax=Candidatus Blochmannia ocreatus (nom. nud.) TaxID=251538 RepID=A0ABY4ST33_9ENTR|nr:hypothetical protein [Candidatus Blochmannia ocreatus]URJ25130.1 hypothetical protein M9405_00090 [Candidatus Blochmannia ocreatus]